MELLLYNTLTRRKEKFIPIDPSLIKMYVCGPTVYDYPHIGNARSAVIYDILFRLLSQGYGKEHVLYVRNITDVDDKIIERAAELQIPINQLTERTNHDFQNNMEYLNCLEPNIQPKATENIDKMIEIITKLIELGSAYIADNHVYFDVLKAKDYSKLSGRQFEDMIHSVRIEQSSGKKHQADFVLWKPADKKEAKGANFESPWGEGRPGWHIECSAMSNRYLGQDFDIHGGGADLIFPHHTNEIAQSTCAYPGSKFANYWVHNGFLTCNGEKMSKSLGNFITVQDFMNKKIDGNIVRLLLLSANYRKPLDFNEKALSDAEKQIHSWRKVCSSCLVYEIQVPEEFIAALMDDLNTPLAIKIINDLQKLVQSTFDKEKKDEYASQLVACARFIGLLKDFKGRNKLENQDDINIIEELIARRTEAKREKNWSLADQIRAELKNNFNVILEDKADGTTAWEKNSL
jgi:cysteinyl-tRNA synthetase